MTVKTYRARSMQEALALVRQELGSQAAVLHTREVRSRGLARLWGGGDLIEVVASDNVSVPGRLPDLHTNAHERFVPPAPAGIDLTEMSTAAVPPARSPSGQQSRIAAYLDQGVQPLSAANESNPGRVVREGAPLLLVCGPKQSGATTVSWMLAQAMAGQGRRAVWVDGNVTHGNRPSAPAGNDGTLADVLSGRRTVHEVLTRGPDGVQCIRRAQGEQPLDYGPADANRCIKQLQGLAPYAEVVIVDVGDGAGPLHDQLWRSAGAVCVVITPADEAILRGYSTIKHHHRHARGMELLALVNRADESAAECVAERIAQACRQFLDLELAAAGHLPEFNQLTKDGSLERTAETVWDMLTAAAPREPGRVASN